MFKILDDMSKILVTQDTLFWAFRYALGRRTGVPSTVVTELINLWGELSELHQLQIHREITEAIEGNHAGDNCDIEEWNKILKLKIKKETHD